MSGTGTNRGFIEGKGSMTKSWGQQFKSALFGMVMGLIIPTLAFGQATLLPDAKQQYLNDAADPVSSGRVDYYIPGTLTRKTVWQDANKATPQTNGVALDAAGRPQPTGQTYGDGCYRQKVTDQNSLTVWDANTCSTGGSGGGGGGSTVGDGNFVGTILTWSGIAAPTNYVFANGQEISRTTYSQYLSTSTVVLNVVCTSGTNVLSGISDTQNIRIGAPVEATCVPPNTTVTAVSSSSVTVSLPASISTAVVATFFPHGNGNGSTTFNVPDLRDLVPAGRGTMGGTTDRGLLTSTFFGPQVKGLGGTGGQQLVQIATSNLPPYTPTGTITNGVITVTNADPSLKSVRVASGTVGSGSAGLLGDQTYNVSQLPSSFLGDPQGGTQTATTNVPPTFITNYVVKVLPDTSTVVASGVASLGGMTGVIACGPYLVCGSQTISGVAPTAAPTNVAVYASNYGVLCNGVNDDYPGTRDAVAAALALGAVPVIMPSGTCPMISGTPTANVWAAPGPLNKPGLNIIGQGRDVTIIDNRQANGYGLAVNQAWESAFSALNSLTPQTTGGALSTNTYQVQITMNDGLGNEIEVTLPKSASITGPIGSMSMTLPPTTPGYSFNIYCGAGGAPTNYCLVAGVNASALGGNQAILITALGSVRAVPTNKLALFQQAYFKDLTVTSTNGAAGANGILLFKGAYTTFDNVLFKNLKGSGLKMPNYIGDIDGSFVTTLQNSKADNVQQWCLDVAGLTLEQSNFTMQSSALNLCGTPTVGIGTSVTISGATASTTPVIATATPHNLQVNDQIDLPSGIIFASGTVPADLYRVGTVVDSTHFQLKDLQGVFINTTGFGAFTSGTVALNWRPPTVSTGTGGIRYMGLISNWLNNGATQVHNTMLYFVETGTSDGATYNGNDCENTDGKCVYAGSLTVGKFSVSEYLSNSGASLGSTVGNIQFGTGFAAGGVSNINLFPAKIRNDVPVVNSFELFQNTGASGTSTSNIRIENQMSWQSFDNTARQKRFVGPFSFNPIPGQAHFLVSATNVFKLVPTGYGCTIPLHLKATGEWTSYCVPDAGATFSVTTSAPGTSYNVYTFNSGTTGFPIVLSFGVDVITPGTNQGFSVRSTDSTQTFVGTWTTDGSGNFQPGGTGTSWYPPALGGGGGGAPSGPAGGDLTGTYPNPTLAAIGSATGPLGSATVAPIVTIDTKGRVTALSSATVTPAVGSLTGLGTGVATALGTNVGTAGSVVVNGGVLGTPSSGNGSNLTALNASNLATGTASVSVGGSGAGTFTSHCVLLGEGTSAFGCAVGSGGNSSLPLVSQGGSADPIYTTLAFSAIGGWGTGVITGASTAVGTTGGFPTIIAKGTIALGTSAVGSGACSTAATSAGTGIATTDVVDVGFNGDPTGTTGYLPTAMLSIVVYPTANTVNIKQCNLTGASITPSALTLNWAVRR